jgi:hypothetical protein
VPGAANIEERLDRQNGVDRNVTDPVILPRLLQVLGEVGTLESFRVVALPDVGIALGVDFEIKPTLLCKKRSPPVRSKRPRRQAPCERGNPNLGDPSLATRSCSCRGIFMS